jgi:CRP/FNR family transcriptional regulator
MTEPDATAALAEAAPGLPAPLRAALVQRGRRVRFADGQRLFSPGAPCEGFVIVLSGGVRVDHVGSGGRSVVLYRIAPGETCVMTTTCLVTGSAYSAWGHAEGTVDALVLPAATFQALMAEDAAFRAMALGIFATRLGELVQVIDELLLHRVDLRLAEWLAARAPTVNATHQTISGELGTAREVVSRILKDFERRGWIALARGTIAVLDARALAGFAAQR